VHWPKVVIDADSIVPSASHLIWLPELKLLECDKDTLLGPARCLLLVWSKALEPLDCMYVIHSFI